MSRQFRFYLLPPQLEEIISELKEEFSFRIIANRSPTKDPMELASVVQKIAQDYPHQGRNDVGCYFVPPFAAPLSSSFAPRVNDWFINSESSEIVELQGCGYDGMELHIGRFYFQTNYLNVAKDELIPHRQLFIKWGEKLFRAAKRRLYYSRDIDAYTDEATEAWRQLGGRFVAL